MMFLHSRLSLHKGIMRTKPSSGIGSPSQIPKTGGVSEVKDEGREEGRGECQGRWKAGGCGLGCQGRREDAGLSKDKDQEIELASKIMGMCQKLSIL